MPTIDSGSNYPLELSVYFRKIVPNNQSGRISKADRTVEKLFHDDMATREPAWKI